MIPSRLGLKVGAKGSEVNEKGVEYYNNLIDALLKAGITPMVTIFHFDTPQVLEDAYGGFLSGDIVSDFVNFAKICFERFGDRVKYWNTINEVSNIDHAHIFSRLADV